MADKTKITLEEALKQMSEFRYIMLEFWRFLGSLYHDSLEGWPITGKLEDFFKKGNVIEQARELEERVFGPDFPDEPGPSELDEPDILPDYLVPDHSRVNRT